jgi:hypothetical protein
VQKLERSFSLLEPCIGSSDLNGLLLEFSSRVIRQKLDMFKLDACQPLTEGLLHYLKKPICLMTELAQFIHRQSFKTLQVLKVANPICGLGWGEIFILCLWSFLSCKKIAEFRENSSLSVLLEFQIKLTFFDTFPL